MRPFLLLALASYASVSDGKDILVPEEVRTSIVGNDIVVFLRRNLRCAMGDLGMNRIPPMNTGISSTSLFDSIHLSSK